MEVIQKFYEKTFKSNSYKAAYAKAFNFIGKNIISKAEIEDTFWKVKKVSNLDLPAFKLELYCIIDTKGFDENFCKTCTEFHRAFYINQDTNCGKCNMKAYQNRLKDKIKIKAQYKKERFEYMLKKQK